MGGRSGRGFTLFELVVVICLVAVVGSITLDRFLRYQEYAERVAMENTVAAMRSALALRASALLIKGGIAEVPALARENPFNWLSQLPESYRGEVEDARQAGLDEGAWYFDLGTREAVYRPRLTQFFLPGPDGEAAIRFRAVANLGIGGSGVQFREVSELTVRPSRPYTWGAEL